MTKKDFILIADALIKAKGQTASTEGGWGLIGSRQYDELAGIELVMHTMADAIAREYPRFKRDRWLDYIAGECGPNGGKH